MLTLKPSNLSFENCGGTSWTVADRVPSMVGPAGEPGTNASCPETRLPSARSVSWLQSSADDRCASCVEAEGGQAVVADDLVIQLRIGRGRRKAVRRERLGTGGGVVDVGTPALAVGGIKPGRRDRLACEGESLDRQVARVSEGEAAVARHDLGIVPEEQGIGRELGTVQLHGPRIPRERRVRTSCAGRRKQGCGPENGKSGSTAHPFILRVRGPRPQDASTIRAL